ncbi:hypothetical protein BCR44DRAFT_67048 [Catenaria anguillulae PL171]|uniref:Polymerase/histidinol phosphatase N-terminal domain-containing protein n=1 Tax=Catenaria anguillulae PL171 TaxID=765915 RepID=A0A1Y2HVK4_9FUNG|nr:hypothetical protein BCR44DRAFT_67048 [Catenaria anguillulae PL171]
MSSPPPSDPSPLVGPSVAPTPANLSSPEPELPAATTLAATLGVATATRLPPSPAPSHSPLVIPRSSVSSAPAHHRLTVLTDSASVSSFHLASGSDLQQQQQQAPLSSSRSARSQLAATTGAGAVAASSTSVASVSMRSRAPIAEDADFKPSLHPSSSHLHLSRTGDSLSVPASSDGEPSKPKTPWQRRARACAKSLCKSYLSAVLFLTFFISFSLLIYYKVNEEAVLYSEFKPTWQPLDPRSMGLVPFNPQFPMQSNANSTILVADLHAHTTVSDGRLSPKELLRSAIAQGFNVIAVTDHNTVEGGRRAAALAANDPEFKGKILVLPGVEYTCCRIHMNLIGINETIAPKAAFPTDEDIKQAIRRTHELGGIAIVNHIPWSLTQQTGYETTRIQNHPTRQQLVEWGIDGIEVVNGDILDYVSVQFSAQPNSKVPLRRNSTDAPAPAAPDTPAGDAKVADLILITGTDTHFPGSIYSWNLIDIGPANSSTPADPSLPVAGISAATVLDALRARRNSFLFDPKGTIYSSPPLPSNPRYTAVLPLKMVGSYLQSFYTYRRGMFSFVRGFCHDESVETQTGAIAWAVAWVFIVVTMWAVLRFVGRWIVQRVKDYRFAGRRGGWLRKGRVLEV